jgi:hypothetical protein
MMKTYILIMKTYIFVIAILFSSCRSSQELISYEFSHKQQATAHWESKRSVNIALSTDNEYSVQIIDGAFYGDFPFSDTILISGVYVKNKDGYLLTDANDPKVKFKVRRYKDKIWFRGIYYNKRSSAYVNIRNESKF